MTRRDRFSAVGNDDFNDEKNRFLRFQKRTESDYIKRFFNNLYKMA